MPEPGVVIARDDGVVVLLDAIPVPADVQQQIDALCDMLGAPASRSEVDDDYL